jgi:hypothetical protein
MVEDTALKVMAGRVIFNGMTTLMNFIKTYQFFQNLIRGGRHTKRQAAARTGR